MTRHIPHRHGRIRLGLVLLDALAFTFEYDSLHPLRGARSDLPQPGPPRDGMRLTT